MMASFVAGPLDGKIMWMPEGTTMYVVHKAIRAKDFSIEKIDQGHYTNSGRVDSKGVMFEWEGWASLTTPLGYQYLRGWR
jgi:hypothetical protein